MKDLARLNYVQGQIEILTTLIQSVGRHYPPYMAAERYLENLQREDMIKELQ